MVLKVSTVVTILSCHFLKVPHCHYSLMCFFFHLPKKKWNFLGSFQCGYVYHVHSAHLKNNTVCILIHSPNVCFLIEIQLKSPTVCLFLFSLQVASQARWPMPSLMIPMWRLTCCCKPTCPACSCQQSCRVTQRRFLARCVLDTT